ncbi:hypothetical protein PGTUg99_001125 [Puccinia graminis f. sp. tritici]|uniref:Uncharacterized protein n=1 Tax=Puccinia graminis f. sp. tritici TaxID=56615 RepID=A0A5B0P7P4_PUCGR|nr:hypothetical protein PGTUg99_001125 [Puccinia graminis f. sp. tritici]
MVGTDHWRQRLEKPTQIPQKGDEGTQQEIVSTTSISITGDKCLKLRAYYTRSIGPAKKTSQGALPKRVPSSGPECCCKADRGEGSSSGSTLYQRIIPARCSADPIPGFEGLDIKGKGKEKC